eukprot:TRINITY_DN115368_c0_g1_i1.p1 TRINITY_DN115368_c0_g1~~TRINITY_DN115368_c0_g1_i1.p1  ORF type:complete len:132 (-),score=15.53 TRINITY_DN115368_c0_g1_i1:14-358(-)
MSVNRYTRYLKVWQGRSNLTPVSTIYELAVFANQVTGVAENLKEAQAEQQLSTATVAVTVSPKGKHSMVVVMALIVGVVVFAAVAVAIVVQRKARFGDRLQAENATPPEQELAV